MFRDEATVASRVPGLKEFIRQEVARQYPLSKTVSNLGCLPRNPLPISWAAGVGSRWRAALTPRVSQKRAQLFPALTWCRIAQPLEEALDRPRQGALLAYIDPLRSRVVSLLSLWVAASSLVSALWWRAIEGNRPADPLRLRLLVLQIGLALAAATLAHFHRRAWAARLLALDLILLPTLIVHLNRLPFFVAFASYLGALFVVALGARTADVVASSLLVIPLTALLARAEFALPDLWPVLASSLFLLLVTGGMFLWVVEALRRGISGLEASEAYFQRLSHLDPLTGLGNRRLFEEALTNLLSRPNLYRSVALVVLDVNNLKQINDNFGHLAGDQALRRVAQAIRASIRERDLAARIGGDEFAIILATGGLRGAQQIASRIRQRLDDMATHEPEGRGCSVSIGIAAQTSPGQTAEELLAAADAQLYANRDHLR